MKLLLLGPPGVGKGTQATLLCEEFSLAHVATGDLLRQNVADKTALGIQAKAAMDAGQLVADDIIISMMREHLQTLADNFLLDGYPRTIVQAESLCSSGIHMDVVVNLDAADEVIVSRLSGRRVHVASGRTYHVHHNPPKREGVDDATGEPLIQRDDDRPETIAKRLAIYREQTAPLADYYQNYTPAPLYLPVNGVGDIRVITNTLISNIKSA